MIYSLETARSLIRDALKHNPYGLSQKEMFHIISPVLDKITDSDPLAFARLDYYLQQPNWNTMMICANIEFPLFGIMTPRTRNGKVDSLIDTTNLTNFLNHNLLDFEEVSRRRSTVEMRANEIAAWTKRAIATKEELPLLPDEIITSETGYGNHNQTLEMKYISVEGLLLALAHSTKAAALKEYAMAVMALFRFYNMEALTASKRLVVEKDNALQAKDDIISGLEARLNARFDQLSEQNKQTHEQNRELKSLATDQRSDIRKLVRFTDNLSIQKNNAIAVAEDSREQTLALSELALQQHETIQELYQYPALNPTNPHLVQGSQWFYRKNGNGTIDIVLKVGQQRTVTGFISQYVGWRQLIDFKAYASGVNYRNAVKPALMEFVREIVIDMNEKIQQTIEDANTYIQDFADVQEQYSAYRARREEHLTNISIVDSELSVINDWKAMKDEHNQQLKNAYQLATDALKTEITNYNRSVPREQRRSLADEKRNLPAPELIKTKKAWLEFKNIKPSKVSGMLNVLTSRKDTYALQLQSLEKKYDHLETAKTNANKGRRFLDTMATTPDLTVDSIFRSSRITVELAPNESQSLGAQSDVETYEDEATGVVTRTIKGYRWTNNQFIKFARVREFLAQFDVESKEVPIVVDDEMTSIHLLDERLDFLKMEDFEDELEDIVLKQIDDE